MKAGHDWADGACTVCGTVCEHGHHWQNGQCSNCYTEVEHEYSENGLCTCGKSLCGHESHNVNGICDDCGLAVGHTIGEDGICTVCTYDQNLMAFLAGDMNGWSTSANAMQSVGGTKVAGTVYLTAGTYGFKIVYGGNWYGNAGTINSTASGWVMDSDANCTLNAQYSGMYTFVYDTAANTLEVYNKITDTIYLRGDFNEWGTDIPLTMAGTGVQTASVTLEPGTYGFKVANADWTFGQPAENITVTVDQPSELTVTASYNGDGTWTISYEITAIVCIARNESTGIEYRTVQEALDAAEDGQTVILLGDCAEDNVVVLPGVTLDLKGFTLTAGKAVAFTSAHIIDSVGTGRLAAGTDDVVLDAGNAMIPVYDGTGYIFTKAGFAIRKAGGYTGEGFKLNAIACPVNMDVVELLKDGGTDNDLQVMIILSWETAEGTGSQEFVFTDDVVAAVYSSNKGSFSSYGKMFTMTITGIENVENLKADIALVSGTDARYVSVNGIQIN